MGRIRERIGFIIRELTFKVRDLLSPPKEVLSEIEIREGFKILDYGCGSGTFSIAAAKLVGPSGKVYAADISPIAVEYLERVIIKKRLSNIEVIQTDCATNLPSNSIDVVLLYDIYHGLNQAQRVIQELDRVLKSEGKLSFSDHHMTEEEITSQFAKSGLFKLSHKGEKTYTFTKGKNETGKRA